MDLDSEGAAREGEAMDPREIERRELERPPPGRDFWLGLGVLVGAIVISLGAMALVVWMGMRK